MHSRKWFSQFDIVFCLPSIYTAVGLVEYRLCENVFCNIFRRSILVPREKAFTVQKMSDNELVMCYSELFVLCPSVNIILLLHTTTMWQMKESPWRDQTVNVHDG